MSVVSIMSIKLYLPHEIVDLCLFIEISLEDGKTKTDEDKKIKLILFAIGFKFHRSLLLFPSTAYSSRLF